MSTFYVAGIPYSSELYHHGIKGQKWGIRRYQNPDGSLTSEGTKRYGKEGLGPYKSTTFRRLLTGDYTLGSKRIRENREERLKNKAQNAENEGNKVLAKKYKEKYEILKSKNVDRDRYISNTSTSKLVAQNLLLGFGAIDYRDARSTGSSRGEAFVEALPAFIFSRIIL